MHRVRTGLSGLMAIEMSERVETHGDPRYFTPPRCVGEDTEGPYTADCGRAADLLTAGKPEGGPDGEVPEPEPRVVVLVSSDADMY